MDETARVVFTSLIRGLDRSVHMLVLMTAHCRHINLPLKVDILFVFLIFPCFLNMFNTFLPVFCTCLVYQGLKNYNSKLNG